MCFRYSALVLRGAILICADAVVTGFAIGGPVAVGMLMLRTETAVGADVAELILIVVIDVGRAAHFFAPIRAVFGRADVIVTFGVIFPAVKGVGMTQYGGAFIAAVVAVIVAVIVIDMAGFILNAAGFVRAVRVGAFTPMLPALLAIVVGMGRSDGAVVATDITDVSVEGVAGLLGLSGAAGLGAELPVAGTVVVPAAIGVIGMPVATFGAVSVGVEGMGLFILPGFGGGGAVGVGTVTPVAGLIPAVETFGVSVVTDGAGIAAGDAGRAGSTAVIMFGVVGNKIAIT